MKFLSSFRFSDISSVSIACCMPFFMFQCLWIYALGYAIQKNKVDSIESFLKAFKNDSSILCLLLLIAFTGLVAFGMVAVTTYGNWLERTQNHRPE
jgi:hypothetical protein